MFLRLDAGPRSENLQVSEKVLAKPTHRPRLTSSALNLAACEISRSALVSVCFRAICATFDMRDVNWNDLSVLDSGVEAIFTLDVSDVTTLPRSKQTDSPCRVPRRSYPASRKM